jgi:uncharacterized protein (DUF924 family)
MRNVYHDSAGHNVEWFERQRRFENFVSYAVEYCNIIEQFERLPHRNNVIGRAATAAALAIYMVTARVLANN